MAGSSFTLSKMECVFCRIITDGAPSSRVFEDERVLAFMDTAPATPGHVLVVPKRHTPSLAQLDPEDGARMFHVARSLALALRLSSIPAQGVNFFLADGEAALQEVLHTHLHVLPRTPGDGFALKADFGIPERDLLDAQAAAIRAALRVRTRMSVNRHVDP